MYMVQYERFRGNVIGFFHLRADGADAFNNGNRQATNSGQLWDSCGIEKVLYVRDVATGMADQPLLDQGRFPKNTFVGKLPEDPLDEEDFKSKAEVRARAFLDVSNKQFYALLKFLCDWKGFFLWYRAQPRIEFSYVPVAQYSAVEVQTHCRYHIHALLAYECPTCFITLFPSTARTHVTTGTTFGTNE